MIGDVRGRVQGFATRWTNDREVIVAFAEGARRAYAAFGCELALDADTENFEAVLVVYRGDAMVGGFAVRRIDPVERRLLLRADEVVIEATAGWRDPDYLDADDGSATIGEVLAANSLIALGHAGATRMVCDSSDHALIPWVRGGARPLTPYTSDTYPTSRYRTIPLCFELAALGVEMDGRLLALAHEQMRTQAGWEVAAAMLEVALCSRR